MDTTNINWNGLKLSCAKPRQQIEDHPFECRSEAANFRSEARTAMCRARQPS